MTRVFIQASDLTLQAGSDLVKACRNLIIGVDLVQKQELNV